MSPNYQQLLFRATFAIGLLAVLFIEDVPKSPFDTKSKTYESKNPNNEHRVLRKFKLDPKTVLEKSIEQKRPLRIEELSCLHPNTNQQLPVGGNLPRPIISVGFPKAGSTTLDDFFKCGGVRSCHHAYKGEDKRLHIIGTCMEEAKRKGLPLIKSCGDREAYTQLDDTTHTHCYWPQIDALDEIHDEYPDATFILNLRPVEHWIKSLRKWRSYSGRLKTCGMVEDSTDELLTELFCNQVTRARDFVAKHPSHALIEFDIEDPSTGELLSNVFGIDEKCWGVSNVGTYKKPWED
mmetsp:Transcript_31677/g.38804  ORF Transcript_31677/g.38804 Transcript_31677/m.38804 type:complete len:293 (-) Transcript_31677:46-924(-)|eukprot:CAMPEP_0172492858 /NCGR_PEP_ID=MMETSP1066-20121228/24113_1 /TAXON_ID=671091 /ORGANISM="Coscinodiscus wailesii, Strain CCMP2513" /LENGTH=292 /DNA_ID=CAMNT_0013262693 /DNA_START=107 /DNA_END=985 /DNA_ORIENTATION=+